MRSQRVLSNPPSKSASKSNLPDSGATVQTYDDPESTLGRARQSGYEDMMKQARPVLEEQQRRIDALPASKRRDLTPAKPAPKPKSPAMAKPASYKKGGVVKKTGMAKVHKGETVIPAKVKTGKPVRPPKAKRRLKPAPPKKRTLPQLQPNPQQLVAGGGPMMSNPNPMPTDPGDNQ